MSIKMTCKCNKSVLKSVYTYKAYNVWCRDKKGTQMMTHRSTRILATLLFLMFSLIGLSIPVIAQDEIALSISVPDFVATSISITRAIEEFEEQNPNIRVEVRSNGNIFIFPPASAGNINRFLAEAQNQMSSADVVTVNSSWMIPELTQSGYVLDIAPLTSGDAQFNEDNFFNPTWQSFQWDGGVWAIPLVARPVIVSYHSDVFDNTQLPYPSESWDIAEFAEAARTLATRDDAGTVTAPGILIWDNSALSMLIRSLLDGGVYDESVFPAVPDYSAESLVNIITTLQTLNAEGVIVVRDFMSNVTDAPVIIGDSFLSMMATPPLSVAILPGGHTGIQVDGLAISRGTQYPEATYQLIRFLTSNAEFVGNYGGAPALQSLPTMMPMPDVDLDSAVPASELRFMNYLPAVVISSDTDIGNVLQVIQADVTDSLANIYAGRESVQINIPTPLPEQVLADGEMALSFGVFSSLSPLPNQGQWINLARDFAEEDAEVGAVNLEVTSSFRLEDIAASYDCFYLPGDAMVLDTQYLTSINPLLASDPDFDTDDMVGSVIQRLTIDNQIWGMPLTIEPAVMWIDRDRFNAAGLPIPQGTWTINEFTAALTAFESSIDGTLITSYHFAFDDIYLLMLIAGYGGLPIDYRTNPPTLNFTEPETVAAIRQVLDLAKAGRINYMSLIDTPMISSSGTTAFVLAPLDDSNSRHGELVRMGGFGGDYQLIAYPSGTDYTPIAYTVGAAYISATAQNPEACYRFIAHVAQHPELFTGMPVRRSQINSPEVLASRGEETVAFYNTIDQTTQSLNAIEFPSDASLGDTYTRRWLDRAFDRYVLEDADLEAELADAQTQTQAFLDCLDAISESEDYNQQWGECMTTLFSETP
jgi:ABC-type glycerol-3-phosphate transport system substrate-binding protein